MFLNISLGIYFMRWFRILFWKLFLLIIMENRLYNQIVNIDLKPKSESWIKNRTKKLIRFAKSSTEYYGNYKGIITDRTSFKEAAVNMLSDKYRNNFRNYNIKLNSSLSISFGSFIEGFPSSISHKINAR